MSRFARPAAMAVLLLMITACASSSGATNAPAPPADTPPASQPSLVTPSPVATGGAGAAITIKAFEFMPARLTVHAGDTVTWANQENSLHTVTSGTPDDRTGLFDSGEFDTGETFEYTFAEAGTYSFFCDRHEFMRGEVIVLP